MIIISDYERYANFPYQLVSAGSNKPVALTSVKSQLRITGNTEDTFLNALIDSAGLFFEGFTKQTLITKTYKTYRTIWDIYKLRRCPLQSIEYIKYYDEDGVLQTLSASDYYIIKDNFFGLIGFDEDFEEPALRTRPQQIEIQFKAGFGDSTINIPADIQQGLLEHIAYMYENRGDCIDDSCSNIDVPNSTKLAYTKYKIQEVGV